MGSGGDGIAVFQVSGLHGSRLSSDAVLMGIEEESDSMDAEEVLVRCILCNNAVFVV